MKRTLLVQLLVIAVLVADAQIYQFRGPDRDGKFPETGLLTVWPEEGPELLLEYEGIGDGWSSVISNGKFIYATGYDYPARMLRVSDDLTSIEEVYTSDLLDNHHHGLIELDGYLYGSYWVHNNAGNWACLDWDTGEVMYDEEWNSKGPLVYADGMFYIYIEKRGFVGLVKPDPSGFQVISSFQITQGSGPHWSHPYIHDGKLFLRHGDVLMVYNLRG